MKTSFRFGRILLAATVLLSGAVATMAQVPQLLNYQGRIAVNGTNFTGTGQFKFALISTSTNASVQATATGTVSYGFLVLIAVNNGGSGYTTPPAVTITDSTGTGASASAQISGGVVTNIVVNSAGSGYSASPVITIAAPPQQNVSTSFWSNDGTSNAGGQPATSVPLPVTKGLYSVLLGDITLSNMATLPVSVFANPGVWLRVWFNDGTTGFQLLTPDQRLAAVGYAIMAGTARTVVDGSITASKIAPGAVGSSQLAPNLTIPGTLTVSNLVVNGSALNGSANFQLPGSTNIQTYAGFYYFITNTPANIVLPPTANIGDTVNLRIANNNGNSTYNIQQNAGQRIVKWNAIGGAVYPITCSADGTRIAVIEGSQQAFYLSTNSGTSWTVQPAMQPFPNPSINGNNAIRLSSDGTHIFSGASFPNYQGVIISPDCGQSWFLKTNFPTFISSIACSTNGSKAVAASWAWNGGDIYTSIDYGSNWTQQAAAPTNILWSAVASSADGTKLVAAAGGNGQYGGIYTSVNSGLTWTLQTSAPTNVPWTSVASSADGTKLVAANQWNNTIGGVYVSGNSGSSWTLQTSIPTNAYWTSVASSADGLKIVATANGSANGYNSSGVYTSVNSGSSWTGQTNGLSNVSGCQYLASSADGAKLIGSFNDGNFYSSLDFGNTWSPVTTFPSPTQILVAVSSIGTGGGATFTYLSNGELTLVYLGNGMFAIGDGNWLNGY